MKIGCGVHSDSLAIHHDMLFALPVIEIENFLFPGFADRAQMELPRVKAALDGYNGAVVVSAPYIDLNPGSPERLTIEAARLRFEQTYAFAQALGTSEIIFLSTFIPIIYLSAYEDDWVARSITFWRSFMEIVDPGVMISLGNVFEFRPDYLVQIAGEVNRPNFRLTFDLGHFLVYSRIELAGWLAKIAPYCSTVYVHSNNGQMDTHDEPYIGSLRPDQIALVAKVLAPDARFIIKAINKETTGQSVDWVLKAACSQ